MSRSGSKVPILAVLSTAALVGVFLVLVVAGRGAPCGRCGSADPGVVHHSGCVRATLASSGPVQKSARGDGQREIRCRVLVGAFLVITTAPGGAARSGRSRKPAFLYIRWLSTDT